MEYTFQPQGVDWDDAPSDIKSGLTEYAGFVDDLETIEHYEVLIANQAALVDSMQPSKRRDVEQMKLNNLRSELEAVKAQ